MTKDEALKLALEALEANYLLVNGTETHGGLEQCMDGYYSGCFDTDPINKQTEEAITAIKEALAQPEQEPIGYVSEGEPDRLIAQKQTKTPLRNYRLFTHDVPLYTTPHTKVGCVECRVSGGHAFYCVACAKNLFGGYKK